MAGGNIFIGTSGWVYNHWKGIFYPEDLKQKEWLKFYSDKLKTVEVNNSLYRLPDEKTFKIWEATTPEKFIFSVKGSRYITHMKKLKDPGQTSKKLFGRLKYLKKKVGPLLFQLPPNWKFDKIRLEKFLKALREDYNYAFEFREKSWWNDDTLGLLKEYNAAFCIFELAGTLTPKEITADFIYVRLHGPGDKYLGNYNKKELASWAENIWEWKRGKNDVYLYFDNDESGYAVKNALDLKKILSS